MTGGLRALAAIIALSQPGITGDEAAIARRIIAGTVTPEDRGTVAAMNGDGEPPERQIIIAALRTATGDTCGLADISRLAREVDNIKRKNGVPV
jgi:hypothetical protein